MSLKYVRPDLLYFKIFTDNVDAVGASVQKTQTELARLEQAYRRHLGRIRKYLPVRFRQWLSRHIYLHDAVVHGPTEEPKVVCKNVGLRGVPLDGEYDGVHVQLHLQLLIGNGQLLENGKNLVIKAEHPGQAFVLLCYLGVLGHEVSRYEQICPNGTHSEKLWLDDEVDVTQQNQRRYPVHRILFSDGTVSEIIFQDFHCFETRLL